MVSTPGFHPGDWGSILHGAIMLASLAYYLKNNRDDCLQVLRISNNIGNSLNSRCDRFFKAEIIDQAYSRVLPRLKYVDEIGYDFTFFHWKVSQKSQASVFKRRSQKTNKITISNLYNSDDIKYKIFDYIIITQTSRPFSIAVAEYGIVSPFLKRERDSISAEIPFSCLDFIIHPDEDIYFDEYAGVDFKAYKNEMITKMLDMGLLKRLDKPCLVG